MAKARQHRRMAPFGGTIEPHLPHAHQSNAAVIENMAQSEDPEIAARVAAYQNMLARAKACVDAGELHSAISTVDAFFNAHIDWEEDQKLYRTHDFWATPQQTLSLGQGDCEDFALAKYHALRAIGIKADRLRLTVGKVLLDGEELHMVLTVQDDEQRWVLDNLPGGVQPLNERSDFTPGDTSFNEDHIWYKQQVIPTSLSTFWRDYTARAGQEPYNG